MKLALYKAIKEGYVIVREVRTPDIFGADYVRISAIVDVEFPPLPPSEALAQLDALEAERARTAEQHVQKLAAIDQRRDELMKLTGEAA